MSEQDIPAVGPAGDGPSFTYADFGRAFLARAVTAERILGAVAGIADEPVAFGPIKAGPGGVARVTARGTVGEAEARRLPGEEVAFRLIIPVVLDLDIDLGLDAPTFRADVRIHLTLRARAAPPLCILIDIEPPHSRDVVVEIAARTRRGGLLQLLAGIDRELARFVARYVARELAQPRVAAAREIDVGALIDSARQRE